MPESSEERKGRVDEFPSGVGLRVPETAPSKRSTVREGLSVDSGRISSDTMRELFPETLTECWVSQFRLQKTPRKF